MSFEKIDTKEQLDKAAAEGGVDIITTIIGKAGQLDEATAIASALKMLHIVQKFPPMTAITFCIGGYDDDERPICDIPEAREFVLRFTQYLEMLGVPPSRFTNDCLMMVMTCKLVDEGKTIIWEEEGEVDLDMKQIIEDFRARVRSSMN